MKQEDEIRLWEWCGWRIASKPYEVSFVDGVQGKNIDVEFWYSPDEPNEPQAIPELTLDNLFKYAVPKLTNLWGMTLYPPQANENRDWYCILKEQGINSAEFQGYAENPAEALAQAISKVIDNE